MGEWWWRAKGRDGDAWIEAERGEEITTEELTADAMDSDTEEIEGEEEIAKDDPIEDKKEDRPIIDGELVKQKKSDVTTNIHEIVSTLEGSVEAMRKEYNVDRANNKCFWKAIKNAFRWLINDLLCKLLSLVDELI